GHFQGKKSGIFDIIIPKIKELKKELGLDFNLGPTKDAIKEMAQSLSDMVKTWTDSATGAEAFDKALGGILKTVNTAIESINALFVSLSTIKTLISYAFGSDEEKMAAIPKLESAREFFRQNKITSPIVDFVESNEFNKARLNRIIEIYNQANDGKKKKDRQPVPFNTINGEDQKHIMRYWRDTHSAVLKDYISGVPGMEDGIISPGGKITRVSPDDWVFALKDIKDLAGAFLPAGINTNNNMNAPANYVINQTLNVGAGVRAQEVKASAYKGTADALQNSLNNASRIMQLMPGTK
ncbi:MAG: hypothetical protein J6Q48_04685, partial [Bacteroidaceae bacterium]|nr:hypothetical protein [Bacteroidaceae bacterium]